MQQPRCRQTHDAMQACLTPTAILRMMRRADLAVDQMVHAGATEGISSLMVEEMRGVFMTEMDKLIPALAPACWPRISTVDTCTRTGRQVLVPSSDSEGHNLAPGHVIASKHVLAALDSTSCIRAQSALARPGSWIDALQQCRSLTQLVRCVLGQTGGVVGQLIRGIGVERLAAAEVDKAELVHAFEEVPALVRLLPRRDQATPGRLLMAQQRLLLAHLGTQERLSGHLNCLDFDTVLKTLEYFEDQTDLPRNWRRCWLDVEPSLASLAGVPASTAHANSEKGEPETEAEPEPEAKLDETTDKSRGVCGGTVRKEIPVCESREREKLELDHVTDADAMLLRTQISRVLAQVHPGMEITSAGHLVLAEILFSQLELLLISSAWQRARERLTEEAAVGQAACTSSPRRSGIRKLEVSFSICCCRARIAW